MLCSGTTGSNVEIARQFVISIRNIRKILVDADGIEVEVPGIPARTQLCRVGALVTAGLADIPFCGVGISTSLTVGKGGSGGECVSTVAVLSRLCTGIYEPGVLHQEGVVGRC